MSGFGLALSAAAITLVASVLAGAAPAVAQAPPVYRHDQQMMKPPPAAPVPLKKRLAVARFDDSASVENSPFGVLDPVTKEKHQNDDVNSLLSKELAVIRGGFTERLVTALFATDRFIVVERSDIHKILREQEFARTGRVSGATALPIGSILSAQYILTGLITFDRGEGMDRTSDAEMETTLPIPGSRFRVTQSGKQLGAEAPGPTEMRPEVAGQTPGATDRPEGAQSGGAQYPFGPAQFECPRDFRRPPRYALHMRVYDVSTSQIVSAVRVSADTQWCLVKAAVQRMVAQTEKFPWKTRVASVADDRVILDGGRDVNMTFDYRLVHHPVADRSAGVPRGAGPAAELQIAEITEVATIAKPLVPGVQGDIRVGDWVVFNPDSRAAR